MIPIRTAALAAGLLAAGTLVPAGSPPPAPPAPPPAPPVAEAPPPRAVEDTRVYRDHSVLRVPRPGADNAWRMFGVEWRVTASVRRLASTGKDAIDLRWS